MKKKRLLSLILTLLMLTQIIPSYALGTDISTGSLKEEIEDVEEVDTEIEEVENSELEKDDEVKDLTKEVTDIEDENVLVIDKDGDIEEQMQEAHEQGQKVLFKDMTLEEKQIEIYEELEVEFNNVILKKISLTVYNNASLKLIKVKFEGSYEADTNIRVDEADIIIKDVSISGALDPIDIMNSYEKITKIEGLSLEDNINDGPLIVLNGKYDYLDLELTDIEIKNNRNNTIDGKNVKFNIKGMLIEDYNIADESNCLGLFIENTTALEMDIEDRESVISDYVVDVNRAPNCFNDFDNVFARIENFKFTGTDDSPIESSFLIENSEVRFINGEFNNISRLEILEIKNISGKDDFNLIEDVIVKGYSTDNLSLIEIHNSNEDDPIKNLIIDGLTMNENKIVGGSEHLIKIEVDNNVEIKNSDFIKNLVDESMLPDGRIIAVEIVDFNEDAVKNVVFNNIKINENSNITSGMEVIDGNVEILDSEFIGNDIWSSNDGFLIRAALDYMNDGFKTRFVMKNSKIERNIMNMTEENVGNDMFMLMELIEIEGKIENVDIVGNDVTDMISSWNSNLDIDNIYISKNKMWNVFDVSGLLGDDGPIDITIKNPKIVDNETGSIFVSESFEGTLINVELLNGTIANNIMNVLLRPLGSHLYEDEADESYINIKNTIMYNNRDMTREWNDLGQFFDLTVKEREYTRLVGNLMKFTEKVREGLEENKDYYKPKDIDKGIEMLEEIEELLGDLDVEQFSKVVEEMTLVSDYFMDMEELEVTWGIENESDVQIAFAKMDYIDSFKLFTSNNDEPGFVITKYINDFAHSVFEKYEFKGGYLYEEIRELVDLDRRTENVNFYHSLFNNDFHESFNKIEDFGQDILMNLKSEPLLDENYIPLKGSVVIDKGNNEYVTSDMEYDFTGRLSRIVNNTVDIGAHEYIEKIDKPEPETDPGGNPTIPSFPSVPGEKPTPQPPIMSADHIAYIEGYEDKTVRPNAYISREEMSAMLFRLLDSDYRAGIESENNDFNDVNKNRWSNKHISTLANGNMLLGYPDGSFKPLKNLTRGEAAVLIYRFGQVELDDKDKVKDVKLNDISGHWAEKEIKRATERGWIDGYPDGSFKPSQNITRAEMVTLINRMLDRHTRVENMFSGRKTYKDLQEKQWYYEAFEEAINGHKYEKLNDNTEKWTEKLNSIEM